MRDKSKFWRNPTGPRRAIPDRGTRPGSSDRTGHGNLGDAEQIESGVVRIFGMHAVAAALANPLRPISRLRLTENAENRLEAALKERAATVERVHPRDLDRVLGEDTVHQGALLETAPLEQSTLEDLAAAAQKGGPLVVLDQVTDPHNVGAILRSAAVFEASGLIMTRRNAPPLSGALAKVASGALEWVPVALVPNLARALAELGEFGIHRVGLDGEAEQLVDDEKWGAGVALVLGSEGKGLRRLTRESCDVLVRIGGSAAMTSLNVSNAAAIALHTVSAHRRNRVA